MFGIYITLHHHWTAATHSPERVVSHVVAGGDVDHLELGTVPGEGLARVICQPGTAAKVELFYVWTVSCKC